MQSESSVGTVVLAGATGALGGRIARALVRRKATVHALVRAETKPERVAHLEAAGVVVRAVDFTDAAALARSLEGASCVVSALNGLAPVILGTQGALLDAAVRAGVPRFIPSDFALDFTKTRAGRNRNLDLRREFHARLDAAPIQVTSILNGAFTSLLVEDMPLVVPRVRRIVYWGNVQQRYDFTTMDDTARFTAAAACDVRAPRVLRIAGDQVSPADLAAIMSLLTGTRFRTLRAGSTALLGAFIRVARFFGRNERAVFPAWQGMQYMRDMAEGNGKLTPLDNNRYGTWRWTRAEHVLENALLDARAGWSGRAAAHGRGPAVPAVSPDVTLGSAAE